jgi:predicted short-subunit dehydrogenase-like oxidoreductase (DUF2520 family)
MPRADAAFLGVPEGALGRVGAEVALYGRTRIVCHFAGAVGVAPLKPAVDAGILAAALHPVQTCPDVDTAVRRLPGSAWGVTASPELSGWARDLISGPLRGLPVEVAEGDRAVWHAAASTTANGIAALMSIGEAMLGSIGIERPSDVLGPLAAGTVASAAEAGDAARILTGPVVRGEAATVRSHVRSLGVRAPVWLEAYRLIVSSILTAALGAGRIDPPAAESVRRALDG